MAIPDTVEDDAGLAGIGGQAAYVPVLRACFVPLLCKSHVLKSAIYAVRVPD